jgi:hypothetical protein
LFARLLQRTLGEARRTAESHVHAEDDMGEGTLPMMTLVDCGCARPDPPAIGAFE